MRILSAVTALLAWPGISVAARVTADECNPLDCSIRPAVEGGVGGHLLVTSLIVFVALVLIARRHGGRNPNVAKQREAAESEMERKQIMGEGSRPNS